MRPLLLTLAALLVCVFNSGCSSAKNTAKQNILRVIRADEALAKKRDALPANSTPSQVAHTIGIYCAELEALDMSDCPPEFRVAYRHHIGAWRELQAAVREIPDGFWSQVFAGALNAWLRGEADGGTSRLEGGVNRALERIRDTWIEVERIAASYDAVL